VDFAVAGTQVFSGDLSIVLKIYSHITNEVAYTDSRSAPVTGGSFGGWTMTAVTMKEIEGLAGFSIYAQLIGFDVT